MKYSDIKVNNYYIYNDPIAEDKRYLVYIVGRDRFTGKYVASSPEWINGVDLLEDHEFEYLKEF